MIEISPNPFEPSAALARFERRAARSGAIVSFCGYVRPGSPSGAVERLYLEAHSPMTEDGIAAALHAASARWALAAAQIVHRIGDIGPGEAIVFVATAAAHRRAAFEAADFLMDYLKTEAFFWKKEITSAGANWIEPRAQDYRDRDRWAVMVDQ